MVVWATNPAQGEVDSAAWLLVFLFFAAVKAVSNAMTELRSQEVDMMANVKSFAAGVVETIWAVGAGVLAA